MIAIGGAIGTGLFLGSGTAIQKAGPAIILAYFIAGIFCFFMMRAIGELILSDLSKNSFIEFVREYLGPLFEFIVGWTYWLCWESLAMADLTASGIYIRYWFPGIPQWLTAFWIIVLLLAFNLLSVGAFGELETWFSSIKVLAILALIGTGVVLLAMNAKVGGHNVSLSNLVSYGGFFPKGFNGLLAAFPMVIFAFTGIEMVGLTSGETADPKRDLPQAIKIAAGVINFVVLTATLSACNSAIFSTSRTLFVLANSGQASKKLGKSNNRSVPVNALVFSSVILFVIVILNFFLPAAIFEIISGIATVSFVFIWIVLVVCHYKYKKRCKGEQTLFAMPLFPVSNWVTIIFFLAVLILLAFSKSTLMSLLFSLVWFACLGAVYNFFIKDSENETR